MKKARSLFSLILSLALVVTSLPMVFMTAVAETGDGGAELTYYVSKRSGSDSNNGSKEAPFATLEKAVATIGTTADGTVVILDTIAGTEGESTGFETTNAAATWLAKFPAWDVTTVHSGTITFKGETADAMLTHSANGLTGPTVFENITLASNGGYFATNGYNFETKGVVNSRGTTYSPTVYYNVNNASGLTIMIMDRTYNELNRAGIVEFNHTGAKVGMAPANDLELTATSSNVTDRYMNDTESGSILTHTIIDNGGVMSSVRLKTGKNDNQNRGNTCVYAGNINYIINQNANTNFIGANNAFSVGKTIYSNLQVVLNNGASMSGFSTYVAANYFVAYGMWLVKSDATEGSSLMTTSTPGTFTVNGNKIAVATNGADPTKVIRSENGVLTLPGVKVASNGQNVVNDANTAMTQAWAWTVTYEDAPVPAPEFDYTAAISPATANVERGANVAVKVSVASTVKENWASAQFTVEYDTERLEFIPDDNASYTYVDENGVITVGIYGEAKELGDVLTLNFRTKAEAADCDVATTVTLTEAGFSTQKDAEESDLSEADITADEAVITITKKTVTITVNATDNGNPILDLDAEAITEGNDIVFGIVSGGENYDYTVTYQVGEGEAVALTPDQDGNYTVPGAAVTDNITITATRTPKSFSVSGTVTAGDGATLTEGDTVKVGDVTLPNETVKATFGTSITFRIPAAVAAGLEAGANYTFTVKVNGTALTTGYSVSADGTEITVDGAYVTGNVEIAVVKNYLAPNVFTVTVDGAGASDVTTSATNGQVSLDAPLTITLNKVAGYDYTVTVTMGDQTLDLVPDNGVYSIEGVTANVTVTVTKVASAEVSATVFFNANGTSAWLVVNKVAKLESGNYTFNGIQMMWTDSYGGAYVTVVFADTNPALDGVIAVDASTTAAVVGNIYDANKTGNVDANDAQFVYNVYNGVYTAIEGNVTVEKLLLADANRDGIVEGLDAQAIINAVIG